ACLAPADLRPEVDPLTGAVRSDPRRADLTASEGAALEHGLRASEQWGLPLLAVAAGPPEIDPVLVSARALGAEVLRVEWGAAHHRPAPGPQEMAPFEIAGEPALLAGALAEAILDRGNPATVLCGDRSAAAGVGAVPALLADRLGYPQALGLVSLGIGPE